MVTYEKILSKGPEAYLPEIVNGKIRFTTDTGRLFLDSDDKRIEITDFVKGKTEEEIIETESPLPKFYLASDTNLLYYYDNNEWKTIKVDIGLATTESDGLMPALLDGDSTKYLRSDGIWADAGNTKHVEIERNAYEALGDEEKRNNKFYMVKDKIEDPALPAHIGYYFKIDNSRLNPSVTSSEPRWCFNDTDAVYMYRKYDIYDSNFSVPTGGPGWGSNTNYLITSNMPLNNCYLITTYAVHGLSARGMIFIPKYIIDNGIGCLTRNGFYSKEDFQYYYIEFWGAWDDESNYSTISTYTFTAGLSTIYPTGAYCTTDRISFCNIPYLVGYDFVTGGQTMQDSLDAYLADRSYSDFPNFYQANYLLFNGAMREYDGTLMLNDVDYTGRIDTSKYALKSELSGYASTADLAGKQDTLIPGENITINGSTISANNTTYDLATTSSIGLIPALNGSTAKYLRSDGIWETPAGGGGGDTNYIELTQVEYDLLTPAEKMNGTLYFITDASSGGSSQTIADVLWSDSVTPSTTGTDITLNHAISDYDFIIFTVNQNNGYDSVVAVAVNDLTIGESYINTGYGASSMEVFFDYASDTTIRIKSSAAAHLTTYTKITGLKFGGSSNVMPNPQGTPTDTLNTIGINNTIYDIAGSDGGGCKSYSNELIYDTYTTSNGTYSLSKSIDNYDALLVCGYGYASDDPASMIVSQYVTKAEYDKYVALIATVSGGTRRMTLNFPDSTHITVSAAEGSIALKYIYGLKFGGMLAPMIYSLDEREVGAWTDDKPLYQKTFVGSTSSGVNITFPLDLTVIDVKTSEGQFITSAGVVKDMPFTTNSTWHRIYVGSTYGGLLVENNVVGTAVVTLRYTKTTDTAGSGSYGSLGVPMVHYDDTEKVVGTYFGKTLYEKSYQNIAGTGTTVNVTLSDLSNIETIFIVPEASASTDAIPFPYVHYDTGNLIGGFFTISNGVPTLNVRRGSSMSIVGLKYLTVRYTKSST